MKQRERHDFNVHVFLRQISFLVLKCVGLGDGMESMAFIPELK
jgi:hypothetical protein